ncbi:protein of unknown function [Ralstonia solanacearum CFBP2957]|nr:protein of unknown function [Ralstonia solanacearum CFBP2957]
MWSVAVQRPGFCMAASPECGWGVCAAAICMAEHPSKIKATRSHAPATDNTGFKAGLVV